MIQSAVEALTTTGLSSWLSFLTNALASSGVALGGVWAERGSADKNIALSDAGKDVWAFIEPNLGRSEIDPNRKRHVQME